MTITILDVSHLHLHKKVILHLLLPTSFFTYILHLNDKHTVMNRCSFLVLTTLSTWYGCVHGSHIIQAAWHSNKIVETVKVSLSKVCDKLAEYNNRQNWAKCQRAWTTRDFTETKKTVENKQPHTSQVMTHKNLKQRDAKHFINSFLDDNTWSVWANM